eukprot:jgi/Botrbrau1/22684/Bobra.0132s0027.1
MLCSNGARPSDLLSFNPARQAWRMFGFPPRSQPTHSRAILSALKTKEASTVNPTSGNKLNFPPGLATLPLIGNFHKVRLYPDNKISEDCQRYFLEMGDDVNVLSLDMLGLNIYILRHPDEINTVTSSAGLKKFGKDTGTRLKDWLGDSFLLATNLQLWSEVRTTLNPGFGMDYLRGCLPAMASGAAELASIFEAIQGRELDIQDLCKRATLDIFGKVSFSYDFGSLEVGGSPPPEPSGEGQRRR